ncbi:MAG: molybdopterin oxidoreductase family protein [Ardenticatenaceae bacterium]|nr:molybdopterin oxidoreductase family protein [Ardenticatenaceae bacterium]
MSHVQTHYRTCNLCEAMCGLEIKYQDRQILSIKGDKNDPFSQGHICPKATALQDIYEDPDRLRYPVKRTENGWQQISWEQAFDEAVAGIQGVQAKYGRHAVGIYLGNPNVHNWGSLFFGSPTIRALNTKHRFSATSADQLPSHFAARFMFGHYFLIPIPDIDHTDYMLMLGANPIASNGSLMTAPGMDRRLKAIQQRGGQVVVLDPRRTETAQMASAHHFIRPGTDALFLLALIHTIYAEGLVNPGRLAQFTDGLEMVEQSVAAFTPEAVTAATGITAATIRQIARDFCGAESAVCYGRMGVSTQQFGGLCQWLINVLNTITGNLDRRGGAMFPLPAFDVVGITRALGGVGAYGRWRSRVRDLPEFNGELPASTMAEEILTPGEDQIRAMVTVAGNPVLSTPNGTQLDEAFNSLEFMVAIDIYVNETTRHAHIILPPTTGLETDHYDLAFHLLAVRNTAKYSPVLFAPEDGRLADWQILHELRTRLDKRSPHPLRQIARLDVFKRLAPDKILDLGLRLGPYGGWGKNINETSLTFRKLKNAPHGIDLGPLQPNLKERICTENGRIHLAPEEILADLPRLTQKLETGDWRLETVSAAAKSPVSSLQSLALIGRRHLRSNNSWMHNSERLVKGKDRCTLLMHPDDAEARQMEDGQIVTVSSRVGQVQLRLEVSETMMPGVVSIPHGWGHGRDGVQLQVAQQHAGVSLNDLTDEQQVDALTGNAAFNGVPVQVWGSAN